MVACIGPPTALEGTNLQDDDGLIQSVTNVTEGLLPASKAELYKVEKSLDNLTARVDSLALIPVRCPPPAHSQLPDYCDGLKLI
jgi:hypothetical protein